MMKKILIKLFLSRTLGGSPSTSQPQLDALIYMQLKTLSVFLHSVMAAANQGNPETAQSVYEFNVKDIKGNDVSMEKYRGHVLIIVNVASKCGYTAKHYAELNELYEQYGESKGEFELRL